MPASHFDNSLTTSQAVSARRKREHFRSSLAIRTWGIDSVGKAFSQAARTVEISARGARLTGIHCVQPGEVIGIQYRDQKARFRVVWIGDNGTANAGTVGVECIEPEKCLWMAELEQQASAPTGEPTFTPALPPGVSQPEVAAPVEWPEQDRRRFQRFHCSGAVKLKQIGTDFQATQKILDISLGGCYGESLAPFEPNTELEMTLEICGERISARGMVRTCHPSMGNGIGFTHLDSKDWQSLMRVIEQLGGGHSVPQNAAQPELNSAIAALLCLLEKKGVCISREEFVEELHRVRT